MAKEGRQDGKAARAALSGRDAADRGRRDGPGGAGLRKWLMLWVAVFLGVIFILVVALFGLMHTTSSFRWIIGIALIQLPLFLGFVAYFFPMRLFKNHPNLESVMKRLKYYFPYICIAALEGILSAAQMMYLESRLPTEWDYTGAIYAVEGDLVPRMQDAMLVGGAVEHALTSFFVFVYFWGWVLIIQVTIVVYIYLHHEKVVKMLTVGLLLCLLVALPFYIFLPINEVWCTNPEYGWYDEDSPIATDTVGVLRHQNNTGAEAVRDKYSNINNCFPSLHTGVSLTIALTLLVNRRWFMGSIVTFIAVSIVISTVYLGIHWLIDIAAGVALAASIVYLLYHLDFKLRFDPARLKRLAFPLYTVDVRWKGRPLGKGKR